MVERPIEAEDAPIEEQAFIVPQVIDFGDIRVARGLSRRPYNACNHTNLTYDTAERRVWCVDCRSTLEGFDAFMTMVGYFQRLEAHARQKLDEAVKARDAVVHRIGAKALEGVWRGKMAACCPHCQRGILPEDAERMAAISREIEIARRRKLHTPTGTNR